MTLYDLCLPSGCLSAILGRWLAFKRDNATFYLSNHVNQVRISPIRGHLPFPSLTWPDMTLLWPWPRCNVWPIIWREISSWIVWCHSHRRAIKTVASKAFWSQLCHPGFLFCFAGWHGLLQTALEATVLIGRWWEWHQTIQLEIPRQMIGQKLHLGQGHKRFMSGQVRSSSEMVHDHE